MPVVRVSDKNFKRVKRFAEPLEDSFDDALTKALDLTSGRAGKRKGRIRYDETGTLTIDQVIARLRRLKLRTPDEATAWIREERDMVSSPADKTGGLLSRGLASVPT